MSAVVTFGAAEIVKPDFGVTELFQFTGFDPMDFRQTLEFKASIRVETVGNL